VAAAHIASDCGLESALGAHGREEWLLAGFGIGLEAADDLIPDPVHVGMLLVAVVVAEAGVAEQQTGLAGSGGGA